MASTFWGRLKSFQFDFGKIDKAIRGLQKPSMSGKKRLMMYARFKAHLEDGLDFSTSLNKSIQMLDERDDRFADSLRVVSDGLRHSGGSAAQAMSVYAPTEELVLIKAGEDSGTLAKGFERAGGLLEAQSKIREVIIKSLAYPVGLLAAANIAIALSGQFMFPMYEGIIAMESWPAHAQAFYNYSTFLTNYVWMIIGVTMIAGATAFYSLPRWTGEVREVIFDRFLPPWSLYRVVQGAGFLYALASLISVDLDLRTSLQRIKPFSVRWLEQYIEECAQRLRTSGTQGEALRLPIFPLETQDDLQMFADSASFGESISRVAERNIVRTTEKVGFFTKIANFFGLLAVGGAILWMIASLYGVAGLIRAMNS